MSTTTIHGPGGDQASRLASRLGEHVMPSACAPRAIDWLASPRGELSFVELVALNHLKPHADSHRLLTFVRRAIRWLASPKRRADLRRAGHPRGGRGSARPCALTRRGEEDAATRRGRRPV